MLSRRELIAAGVAGGLAAPGAAPAAIVETGEQDATRDGQREIAREIQSVDSTLKNAFLTSSVAHGIIVRLRADMETFLRANAKFPDYFEVGVAVFYEIYDWHVKYNQPVVVSRLTDGRYALQFMFSHLILRPDQDRNHVGVPTDRA
jgi:hypothetical protein